MQSSLIRKVSVLKYGVALLGFAALAGSLCVPGFSYDGPNCEGNKGSSAITQVSLLAPDSRTANFADSRTFPKSLYDQISKFLEEIENVEEQYPASLCESLLNCSGLLIE